MAGTQHAWSHGRVAPGSDAAGAASRLEIDTQLRSCRIPGGRRNQSTSRARREASRLAAGLHLQRSINDRTKMTLDRKNIVLPFYLTYMRTSFKGACAYIPDKYEVSELMYKNVSFHHTICPFR